MLINLLKLAIFVLFFSFIFIGAKLNCIVFFIYSFIFLSIIFYDIFKYQYAKKTVVYKDYESSKGILKRFLMGSLFVSIISFFMSASIVFTIILNFMSINNYLFLFSALIVPLVFFTLKHEDFYKNLYKKDEFKYRLEILTGAFLCMIFYLLIIFVVYEFEINKVVELYFSNQNRFLNSQCAILKEMADFLFYQNFYQDKILAFLKHKMGGYFILVFFMLNYFVFFVGILHLLSFLHYAKKDTQKSPKVGLFIGTLLLLAFIVLSFIFAGYLNNYQKLHGGDTAMKSLHDFTARKLDFLNDINETKQKIVFKLKKDLDNYIDVVYDEGAKKASAKIADFEYKWYSDYIKIYHKAVDKNPDEFFTNMIMDTINSSLPRNFYANIDNKIKKDVLKFNKEQSNIVQKYDMQKHMDIKKIDPLAFSVNTNKFTALGIGSALVAKTATKMLIKSSAKLGAKVSTSGAAGGAGTVCGPFAWVCVPVFAVGTWVGGDYIISKGDEFLNKDKFQRSVYESFMKQKEEFKKTLHIKIDRIFDDISDVDLAYKNAKAS